MDTRANIPRVLVVEDDAALSEVVCTFLGDEGNACMPAFSGTEALLLAERAGEKNEPFDLVILDLMLPGLPGEELIGHLRAGGETFRELGGVRYDDRHYTRYGCVLVGRSASEAARAELAAYGVSAYYRADEEDETELFRALSCERGCALIEGRTADMAGAFLLLLAGVPLERARAELSETFAASLSDRLRGGSAEDALKAAGLTRGEIFRRLQSYESAARDYRRCRPARLYVVVYGKRVLDGAQGKTSLSPAALRHDGSCAGAVYQLVVALGIPLTARKHGHPLCCAVYPDDFAVHTDVDVEAPSETFGRLQRERRTALYFPADIVRQPAVGI